MPAGARLKGATLKLEVYGNGHNTNAIRDACQFEDDVAVGPWWCVLFVHSKALFVETEPLFID